MTTIIDQLYNLNILNQNTQSLQNKNTILIRADSKDQHIKAYQLCTLHSQQLIDGHHHDGHLVLGDGPVVVEVVQAEGPAELLLQRAVEEGGEGDQHVLQETKLSQRNEKTSRFYQ